MKSVYIFDLDGTLTDTNGLWQEVDEAFLARRALAVTDAYEAEVARLTFPAAAAFTRHYYGLEDSPEAIMAEWTALARQYYGETAPLKPGAREFLRRCRREGRRLSLFTACNPTLCSLALRRLELGDFFEGVYYAEDLKLEKHAPESFLYLASLLGVEASDCVLFDDSPANCAAARAAGMGVVGVHDDFYQRQASAWPESCHRFIRSFAELRDLPDAAQLRQGGENRL